MVYIEVDISIFLFDMQVAQFYPNRITITTRRTRDINDVYNSWFAKLSREEQKAHVERLKVKKSTVELSKASVRNILQSCNSLFFNSKPRTIQLSNQKFIYNYRASFITLTLPSAQMHTDTEIKQRLNVFLQVLRTKYSINNYVWKAELQDNENIHFHLLIDKYVNHGAIQYYWNKALRPLGYIDAYQQKMSSLTLSEYIKMRYSYSADKSPELRAKFVQAYAKGKKSNWRAPNSTDVRSVDTQKNLSFYLAKYITKSLKKSQNEKNEPKPLSKETLERIEKFGKVWARSQSLSRLKFINKFDYSEIRDIITRLKKTPEAVKDITFDYCRVIYLRLKNCPKWFVEFHRKVILALAKMDNYPFPA